ncbi:hypothetical protein RRG08_041189 [Elysia crispata]|uniref:Uncharacterized protein n=1 Tax=Elysia crispata TaxID=231223 RepID=A0AAE0XZA9_9GAST|nr:hypothetical protein RRG08_041189 [Elysia crispata]
MHTTHVFTRIRDVREPILGCSSVSELVAAWLLCHPGDRRERRGVCEIYTAPWTQGRANVSPSHPDTLYGVRALTSILETGSLYAGVTGGARNSLPCYNLCERQTHWGDGNTGYQATVGSNMVSHGLGGRVGVAMETLARPSAAIKHLQNQFYTGGLTAAGDGKLRGQDGSCDATHRPVYVFVRKMTALNTEGRSSTTTDLVAGDSGADCSDHGWA